jgi:hypothetical protein
VDGKTPDELVNVDDELPDLVSHSDISDDSSSSVSDSDEECPEDGQDDDPDEENIEDDGIEELDVLEEEHRDALLTQTQEVRTLISKVCAFVILFIALNLTDSSNFLCGSSLHNWCPSCLAPIVPTLQSSPTSTSP